MKRRYVPIPGVGNPDGPPLEPFEQDDREFNSFLCDRMEQLEKAVREASRLFAKAGYEGRKLPPVSTWSPDVAMWRLTPVVADVLKEVK